MLDQVLFWVERRDGAQLTGATLRNRLPLQFSTGVCGNALIQMSSSPTSAVWVPALTPSSSGGSVESQQCGKHITGQGKPEHASTAYRKNG